MLPNIEENINYSVDSTNPSNPRWVRFVDDHLKYLIAKSSVVALDINNVVAYRYRPRYLLDDLDVNEEDVWIVLRMNNINLTEGIPHHVTSLKIPTYDAIAWIKEQFSAQVGAEK